MVLDNCVHHCDEGAPIKICRSTSKMVISNTIGNSPKIVVTAVSNTGRNRTRPARNAASLARYPRRRYSLKVSIKTILLLTTMPASAITPRPDMTMPNGRPVIHKPRHTPPVDKTIADIVTNACQPELNCTISTISINTSDTAKALIKKPRVSLISSSSPLNLTSIFPASGVSANDCRSASSRSPARTPTSIDDSTYI